MGALGTQKYLNVHFIASTIEALFRYLCTTLAAPIYLMATALETKDLLTMNGAAPLLPHCYTPAQIQKKDNVSMNQSMSMVASAPVTKVAMSPLLGPENTLCECPFCNASIKTAVQYSTTSRTHMAAALWCLACCLCCVPYGSDSAKNADHYCPSCHRYLGTYEK